MRKILIALWVAVATVASAADAPQLITDFDPPTAEAIGRHMYDQDQLAWKATDILFAHRSREQLKTEKGRGWIVDEEGTRSVVRFIQDGANGPEAAYDVAFPKDGPPEFSVPGVRTLSAEESAQYRARVLALENFDFRCTAMSPNSVAFKDGASGDWRVWVMTATDDPKLTILGGHIRYVITADGKTIKSKERLSKGCGLFPVEAQNGQMPAAQFFTNIVSLKPLESHVFASLAYHRPLIVSTNDGTIWKIDQGRIKAIDTGDAGQDGNLARLIAGANESCKLILAKEVDGKKAYYVGPEVQVISATEKDGQFAPKAPPGTEISAVSCARADIVPAPNDYKVLLAGYVLYINDIGARHPKRMLTLELKQGQLDVEMKDGEMTPDIAPRLQKRINEMQAAMQNAKAK